MFSFNGDTVEPTFVNLNHILLGNFKDDTLPPSLNEKTHIRIYIIHVATDFKINKKQKLFLIVFELLIFTNSEYQKVNDRH